MWALREPLLDMGLKTLPLISAVLRFDFTDGGQRSRLGLSLPDTLKLCVPTRVVEHRDLSGCSSGSLGNNSRRCVFRIVPIDLLYLVVVVHRLEPFVWFSAGGCPAGLASFDR